MVLIITLSIVLCALGGNDNGTFISECLTTANDMNTSICIPASQSENATMAPMNFTVGENSTFIFTTTFMFTDVHIALVDFEGNFLNGLSTNQTNIGVIDVCGTPVVNSLTNLDPLNQTDNVTFDLIVPENLENVTIRILVFFDILNSTNCTWEAWNFTITALNETVCPPCPCLVTVPSTQPQTLTIPQPDLNNPSPADCQTNPTAPGCPLSGNLQSSSMNCPPCPCLAPSGTVPVPATTPTTITGPVPVVVTVPVPEPNPNVTHLISVNVSNSNGSVGGPSASFICTLLFVSLSMKYFL